MRPVLVSYFDLGMSWGLGDRAFAPGAVDDPGIVGLVNPFGSGVRVDLVGHGSEAVSQWRAAAVAHASRAGFDTGWSAAFGVSRAEYAAEVVRHAARHGIRRCEMTIYSIGTVYLSLEFAAGLDERYVRGLLSCFEVAAYGADVSEVIFAVADAHARRAVGTGPGQLAELSRRSPPLVQRDPGGYAESDLFRSFTTLLLCVDDGDAARVAELAAAWQLPAADVVDFEFHGRLHFGWAACLIEPHRDAAGDEPADVRIVRMLRCVQIAHVFLGTCEAFVRLFQDEVAQQVAGYVDERPAGRGPEELNRLRTLALAVVNLSQFNLVAHAAEDRAYFARFAAASGIDGYRRLIRDACEILHNVQVSQRQHHETRRQNLLGSVVLLLTTLTLVSATVDGYNFIREDRPLIGQASDRALLLAGFVLALGLVATFVVYLIRPRRRRRRVRYTAR
jgi:hypothetical protein